VDSHTTPIDNTYCTAGLIDDGAVVINETSCAIVGITTLLHRTDWLYPAAEATTLSLLFSRSNSNMTLPFEPIMIIELLNAAYGAHLQK